MFICQELLTRHTVDYRRKLRNHIGRKISNNNSFATSQRKNKLANIRFLHVLICLTLTTKAKTIIFVCAIQYFTLILTQTFIFYILKLYAKFKLKIHNIIITIGILYDLSFNIVPKKYTL